MSSQSTDAKRHHHCSICSQLADNERGFQRGRSDDTFLPAAANRLTVVRDLKPTHFTLQDPESAISFEVPSSRMLQLKRCPECATYYLFRTDYEFLYGGSEDEQVLERLTDEQAAAYERM